MLPPEPPAKKARNFAALLTKEWNDSVQERKEGKDSSVRPLLSSMESRIGLVRDILATDDNCQQKYDALHCVVDTWEWHDVAMLEYYQAQADKGLGSFKSFAPENCEHGQGPSS